MFVNAVNKALMVVLTLAILANGALAVCQTHVFFSVTFGDVVVPQESSQAVRKPDDKHTDKHPISSSKPPVPLAGLSAHRS